MEPFFMQQRKCRISVHAALVLVTCVVFGGSALAATEKTLYAFTGGNDGSLPNSGLTPDRSGNLYGSTFFGGSTGYGVVYKLSRTSGGWQQTVLYTFQGGPQDGANPNHELAIDAAGNIYGTAISGGSGHGVLFQLTPSAGGWTETVLHNFGVVNGSSETPSSGVIIDKKGNLYGETSGGGSSGNGTIYELKHTSAGWKYTLLYSFAGGNDGTYPSGGLTFDANGNLYGTTTSGGGAANIGTVFELARGNNGTWTESVLHGFQDTADGVNPEAPVIFDSSGNLYGTTVYGGDTSCAGGYGCGEVFELSPSGNGAWTKTTIHAFTDTPDGHAPMAGLTFDSAGNLFGTTSNGGSSGTGALFELSPGSGGWTESVVYSFTNGNDGGFPSTPVLVNSKGKILGTASFGGQFTHGVVFSVTQ
jgi:uncharacterized repeat protein (TIGR03803 family)